ncbi:uracil-DNA glycosylase [Massilia dura]|uniref:Uracil-DNA glycosylase n=1 Tax=Pseudoduganella dura TaxID=321982 RepID=A0A6I3XBV9_9BURK|nr:uracil-DNA glycosylase [Pseudoduganella dura]MUI11593.1 uracil-DNA glycosylase [Pseudoduganella dura]GGY15106.1 hypothetical protein GCM10007386_51470 [Pseudoduganella dura]
MSITQRSNAFLQEMGVGPRWLLRSRAHAAPGHDAGLADEEPAAAAVVPAAVEPRAAVAAPAVVAAPAPAPASIPARAPAAPAPAPAAASAPAASDDDNAWFDNAPAPPPKAPTLKQPAPPRAKAEAPPGDEDTSWFDTVPAAAPVQRAPVQTAITDEEIAAMELPELQAAVRRCTRCRLCETRRAAVPGHGDKRARWLVLGTAPTLADEEAGEPLAGPPGQLLHNMLRAVDLSAQKGAYVTTLVKCRPVADDGGERLPGADELAACRPYLQRELALTGAGLALTLGGVTAKGLLGVAARGKVLKYGELPVVATFHPADLLKKPEDKARAWADLCLARSAHGR